MGVPGPGGPCSEIYIDRGAEYGPDGGPEADEDRYLEIWNLVFMQEELSAVRAKDDFDIAGPLPSKNIDTGMGLERVAYLLQGKREHVRDRHRVPGDRAGPQELSGKKYGASGSDAHVDDVRFRVVADHVRSSLMLIGDGVTPGNEGRGYVLRRLLRRAVRNMRLLGVPGPGAARAAAGLPRPRWGRATPSWSPAGTGSPRSPTPRRRHSARRSQAGTQIFDLAAGEVKGAGASTIPGDKAFALHDTYGFPIDLTLEMAAEAGLSVDEPGFRQLMTEQRERAKADARAKKGQHADTGVYRGILDANGPTEWLAYETLETESKPLALLREGAAVSALASGEIGELVLDRTPFYAESGGQVADAGTIEFEGGKLEVLDVQRPVRGLVVHQVRVVDGELPADAPLLHARVDPDWRTGARQAHSGTHVIHAALREVLGPTALQSGSYNRPGYLRLDFGWLNALSPEQVHDIEQVANNALRADLPVGWQYMTLGEAKDWGALALFGETYDDQKVRVVEIGGPWSRELCGGTHVDHSSQIGTIVVTGEASVGSGNRRIEALTGVEGFSYLARERDVVGQLSTLLKTQPGDIVGRVGDLVERLKQTEKEIEKIRLAQLLSGGAALAEGATDVNGVRLVAQRLDGAAGGDVRTLATDVRGRLAGDTPAVVVLIGAADGKASIVAALNDAAQARGLAAGDLVRAASPFLDGKGGGKADMAQGGGTDVSRIDEALAAVTAAVANA